MNAREIKEWESVEDRFCCVCASILANPTGHQCTFLIAPLPRLRARVHHPGGPGSTEWDWLGRGLFTTSTSSFCAGDSALWSLVGTSTSEDKNEEESGPLDLMQPLLPSVHHSLLLARLWEKPGGFPILGLIVWTAFPSVHGGDPLRTTHWWLFTTWWTVRETSVEMEGIAVAGDHCQGEIRPWKL